MKFPYRYPDIAEAVLNELEEANWGEETFKSEADDVEMDVKVSSINANSATTRPTTSMARDATPEATGTTAATPFKHAKNDPIYGINGILHDIVLWKSSTGRRSHRIDENHHTPSSKVIGQNGIAVGTVFPLRVAAIRDGVHGATMGGIVGNGTDGCFSIVISGHYDGYDRDLGDTIYYSDSKALMNTTKSPAQSLGTDALRRSITTRNHVRVLRAAVGKWQGSPRAGIRYDGLYRVVFQSIKKNNLGGAFLQFKLERLTNDPCYPQPEINTNAPDKPLIDLIKMVRV